jgi:hypothetical protein
LGGGVPPRCLRESFEIVKELCGDQLCSRGQYGARIRFHLAGSQAFDGALCASDGIGGAGCESMSSAAQVTSLAALRLLAIFRTLWSSACTTYSLPILTIE